jgi:hypothetical protein
MPFRDIKIIIFFENFSKKKNRENFFKFKLGCILTTKMTSKMLGYFKHFFVTTKMYTKLASIDTI